MDIDYAIKSNQAIRNDLKAKGMIITAEAIDLGIEALKRIQEDRKKLSPGELWLTLPGETV